MQNMIKTDSAQDAGTKNGCHTKVLLIDDEPDGRGTYQVDLLMKHVLAPAPDLL